MSRPDWELRVEAVWASFDRYSEAEFIALMERLASELPPDSAIGDVERASAFDATGDAERAVPLYRRGLKVG